MTDCIRWAGAHTTDGYGWRGFRGRSMNAHRAAWIEAHGSIPDGLTVDHLCRVRDCVNVEHLQLMTMEDARAQGRATMARKSKRERVAIARKAADRRDHASFVRAGRMGAATKTPEQKRAQGRRLAEWNRVRRPTHCAKGHPFSGDNLVMDGTSRRCRMCRNARQRARRRERRLARG